MAHTRGQGAGEWPAPRFRSCSTSVRTCPGKCPLLRLRGRAGVGGYGVSTAKAAAPFPTPAFAGAGSFPAGGGRGKSADAKLEKLSWFGKANHAFTVSTTRSPRLARFIAGRQCAKAGIQAASLQEDAPMDSRLRGNDEIVGLCAQEKPPCLTAPPCTACRARRGGLGRGRGWPWVLGRRAGRAGRRPRGGARLAWRQRRRGRACAAGALQ